MKTKKGKWRKINKPYEKKISISHEPVIYFLPQICSYIQAKFKSGIE